MPLSFFVRSTTVTPDHTISIPNASDTSDGLMSAADKAKLDSLTPGGGGSLQDAYDFTPSGEIQLSASGGGLVLRDAVVPINAPLLEVTDASGAFIAFNVAANGVRIGGVASSAGVPIPTLRVLPPDHTGITASTEVNAVRTGAAEWTWQAGALALERWIYFRSPTLSFAGASVVSEAVTLEIEGPPSAGTNATISTPLAFRVASGVTSLVGGLFVKNVEIDTAGAAINDVLTYDGTAFVPAPGGGGVTPNLANVYAAGGSAADQTLTITGPDGGAPIFSRASIGTDTSTEGLIIRNPTSATALSPTQNSPALRFSGSVWDGSASQENDIFILHDVAFGALSFYGGPSGGPYTGFFAASFGAPGTLSLGTITVDFAANLNDGYVLTYDTGTNSWSAEPASSTFAQVYLNGTTAADQTITYDVGNGGEVTFARNALTNTLGIGAVVVSLTNETAADAITQEQYSPSLRLRGSGWDTSGAPVSRNVDWYLQNLAQSDGTDAFGDFVFRYDVEGVSSTEMLRILATVGRLRLGGTIDIDFSGALMNDVLTFNGSTWGAAVPSGVQGSIINTQIGYGNASNELTSSANWTYNGTSTTLTRTALSTTLDATGHLLVNTTAAANNAQQFSPSLSLRGNGWNTAASQTAQVDLTARPVQAATNPRVELVLSQNINAGGAVEVLAFGRDADGTTIKSDSTVASSLVLNGRRNTTTVPAILFVADNGTTSWGGTAAFRFEALVSGVRTSALNILPPGGVNGSAVTWFTSAGGQAGSIRGISSGNLGVDTLQPIAAGSIDLGATTNEFIFMYGRRFMTPGSQQTEIRNAWASSGATTAFVLNTTANLTTNGDVHTAWQNNNGTTFMWLERASAAWQLRQQNNALGGTTTQTGMLIENATAAALGAQQISAAFAQEGRGWSTTAGTSRTVGWRHFVVPEQSTEPVPYLQYQIRIGNASYTNVGIIGSWSGSSGFKIGANTGSEYLSINGPVTGFQFVVGGTSRLFIDSTALTGLSDGTYNIGSASVNFDNVRARTFVRNSDGVLTITSNRANGASNTSIAMTSATNLTTTGHRFVDFQINGSTSILSLEKSSTGWQFRNNQGTATDTINFRGTTGGIEITSGVNLTQTATQAIALTSSTSTISATAELNVSLTSNTAGIDLNAATSIVLTSATLAFFGGTPVAQQNAAANTDYSAGAGTTVTVDGQFTGGVGTTGYTIGDIVRALKNYNQLVA